MAIDTTPAPVTAPGASAGASLLSAVTPITPTALMNALAAGATLEARLVATLADGTARLATRLGAVAVKMVDGSEVPPIGGRMTLRVEANSAADGQPLLIAHPSTRADPPPTGLAPQMRGAQETMGQAVASALARQDGLGASLAAVERLVTTRPPPEVAAAAARLLNTRLPLDKAPSAKALAAAMRASGIFLEADLARAAAPAGGDVKAALLALKAALAGLGDAGAAATAKAPTGQGMAAPSPVAAGAPQPSAAPAPAATGASAPAPAVPAPSVPGPSAPGPSVPPGAVPPSLPAVDDAAPAVLPRPPAPPPATPTPIAGAPQPTPRALAAAGLLGLQEIADTPPPARPEPAPVIGHAAPPLRGAWPEPEAARARAADTATGGPLDAGAAEPVARARAGTEAALARLVLDQVASLKDDGAVTRATNPAERQQPQWTFEVPVQMDGRSGSLRFQVTRDGGERREGASERHQASWRLRLAFAIEPLGPIRAQVGLVGGRVAVGIWAERPATVAALSAHSGELRDALVAADFDVDEIHLAEGLPPDAQRRAGRAMLDATA